MKQRGAAQCNLGCILDRWPGGIYLHSREGRKRHKQQASERLAMWGDVTAPPTANVGAPDVRIVIPARWSQSRRR